MKRESTIWLLSGESEGFSFNESRKRWEIKSPIISSTNTSFSSYEICKSGTHARNKLKSINIIGFQIKRYQNDRNSSHWIFNKKGIRRIR